MAELTKRYAIVTGANKGIGLETVRQLALNGIMVVLTARDENRGLEAVEKLKESGLSDHVVFHQVDVADPVSIASLAEFIKSQFGKLDILVNNAGIGGVMVDTDALARSGGGGGTPVNFTKIMTQTYQLAEECLKTNYYGAKGMAEALIPLLKLSDSPRIVNVSSSMSMLKNIPNEWAKGALNDAENLTEERVDEVLSVFLNDFKEGSLETKGWPHILSAYALSKAAMNAYTRILAKKYPNFCINCVCPGYVKTDINYNTGILSVEEGAASPVRYAVVTGANKGIGFETCRQLASKGITVVLTARDEKRGLEAVQKLRESGFDNVVFHQLDVADPATIQSLADFITSQFGKLDILVNNAGIAGVSVHDVDAMTASFKNGPPVNWSEFMTQTHELAEKCLKTNYYGAKRMCEVFIPLLQLADSPKIVNVSSSMGMLKNVRNEWAKGVLNDVETVTEEKIDEVLKEYLKDFKEGSLEAKGWPAAMSAYILSKAAMNAYTRILAKKLPNCCTNCVCPGFVKTDINFNNGVLTVEEGAESVVMLALLSNGGPSGLFFSRKEESSF